MRNALILMCFICVMPFFTLAQVDFAKFYIGSSGCSIVAPGYMITDSTYSEDSSLIYSGEIALDSFHFFIILVEIKNPIPDSGLARETVLVNYLDHLKSSFSITESVGYGRGHTLPGYDQALGVLDYWKDEFGDSWSVKGWTDGRILAVLGIYGPVPYPNPSIESVYLNGFRFPDM